jgi:hypothetical protein
MTVVPRNRNAICLVLALASFLLSMNSPPRLAWVPAIAAIAFAVLAVIRREHGWGFSPLVALLALAFYFSTDHGDARPGLLPPDTVKLASWSWKLVPGPEGRRQIAWNVEVHNTSGTYVEAVRLNLATFDAAGELVLADFAHVTALPPGEIRVVSHLADAFGGEAKADVNIAEVTGDSR